METLSETKPLNTMPDGTCRTIKGQYYKNGIQNFENQSSYGATGVIVAMRGRNPDNPSDRTAGSPTEQRLEPNSQGICNTLTSVQKDNMVLENVYDFYNQNIKSDNLCGTITGSCAKSGSGTFGVVQPNAYRIRKLTPLECWRLMGFSDEDFRKAEQVNSNSQLYKQAGNSIVKDVLMAIFSQMM